MAPGETENNAYSNFWGDEQSRIMVCYGIFWSGQQESVFRLTIYKLAYRPKHFQMTTTENTITYHNTLCWSLQNLA